MANKDPWLCISSLFPPKAQERILRRDQARGESCDPKNQAAYLNTQGSHPWTISLVCD